MKLENGQDFYFNKTSSTKTWQEELTDFNLDTKYISDKIIKTRLKQFITDLRKQDEEELIKMLPYPYSSSENLDTSEAGFNNALSLIKKLIKDYYAK